MKKSEFMHMIKAIVAEEVRRQLPGIIKEAVTKQTQQKPAKVKPKKERSLEEIFESELQKVTLGTDEDPIPEAKPNSNRGIYNDKFEQDDLNQKAQTQKLPEHVRKLLDPASNPMAHLYEGINLNDVSRMDKPQSVASSVVEIPQQLTNKWSNIMSKLNNSNNGPMKKSPEAEMRELEMKRKMLEIKVGG